MASRSFEADMVLLHVTLSQVFGGEKVHAVVSACM